MPCETGLRVLSYTPPTVSFLSTCQKRICYHTRFHPDQRKDEKQKTEFCVWRRSRRWAVIRSEVMGNSLNQSTQCVIRRPILPSVSAKHLCKSCDLQKPLGLLSLSGLKGPEEATVPFLRLSWGWWVYHLQQVEVLYLRTKALKTRIGHLQSQTTSSSCHTEEKKHSLAI